MIRLFNEETPRPYYVNHDHDVVCLIYSSFRTKHTLLVPRATLACGTGEHGTGARALPSMESSTASTHLHVSATNLADNNALP